MDKAMTIAARHRIAETAILVVSQYVEHTYASELLAEGRRGIGYLLKDRIMDVADFADAVRRVADAPVLTVEKHIASILGKVRLPPWETASPRRPDVPAARAESVRVGTARR